MDNETKTTPQTSPIETLLSNKELLARLSDIAKDLKSSAGDATGSPAQETSATPKNEASDPSPAPTAEGLSAALSDPVLMAKLPEVVAALASVSGAERPKKAPHDKRTALLLALRPYLSESRCEAIDYITRIGKLGDVLKNLKLQ
jgi:hypothetical protein